MFDNREYSIHALLKYKNQREMWSPKGMSVAKESRTTKISYHRHIVNRMIVDNVQCLNYAVDENVTHKRKSLTHIDTLTFPSTTHCQLSKGCLL